MCRQRSPGSVPRRAVRTKAASLRFEAITLNVRAKTPTSSDDLTSIRGSRSPLPTASAPRANSTRGAGDGSIDEQYSDNDTCAYREGKKARGDVPGPRGRFRGGACSDSQCKTFFYLDEFVKLPT